MLHRYALVSLLILFASSLYAQVQPVFGKIADVETREPLPGAHIGLDGIETDFEEVVFSDGTGTFRFSEVPRGMARLQISFLGYQTFADTIRVGDEPLDLGILVLGQGSVILNQVQVTAQTLQAVQLGDTTQFNAGAFKTNPDASAEDLVRKMPGVTMQGGRIQAQGEDVGEVLVDGRRFFGDDPNAALRNLPADVVEKVQVFDQQSEQSRFTGVDDGETTKTINIVTKPDRRKGSFGKGFAGYGPENKYHAGGNINFFSGDRRITLLAQTNNINIQNFSSEDLVGVSGGSGGRRRGGGGGYRGRGGDEFLVRQEDGIATTQAFGLNYTDKWGDKMEVNASYFFNHSTNEAATDLERQFVNPENLGQFYRENSSSETENTNHRLNMRLDYTIDENNSILFRPRFSFQQNIGDAYTEGATTLEGTPLNATAYKFDSDLKGLNFSNDILYRHRFNKDRRTFSLELEQGYSNSRGDSYLYSENILYNNNALSDTLDQYNDLLTDGWSVGAEATYTEPIGEKSVLQFEYEMSYRPNQSEKRTFDIDAETGAYDQLNPDLTNVYDNFYLSHEAGVGYRVGDDDFNIFTELNAQWSQLGGEQRYPYEADTERHFFNILPMVIMRYNINDHQNLRLFYRTDTDPPSITDLQEVIDNSDPLRLRMGNPFLEQSYEHRMFLRYSTTNTEKSSNFFAMLGGGLTNNYVGNKTIYARQDTLIGESIVLPQGGQLVSPVNLDGNFNLMSFMTYGAPVRFLKSNLNVNMRVGFNRLPGDIDGRLNYSNTTNLSAGFTLSSNISEKVDFTLSTNGGYNLVRNSINTRANNNYYNQQSELRLNLIIGAGFVARSDITHQWYNGLAEDFDQNYWLWNVSVGKKIFKNQRGEISLRVFDLLNQNTSLQRNITDAYIEDVQTRVLQRYAMLTFTYQLRQFNRPEGEDGSRRGPGGWRGPRRF